MKASILAIGTELTTGQIINKNASTISQKLKAVGIEVMAHLTVPDDKQLILEALQFLQAKGDALFITGGLGPTSDDFTRDVVAEWAGTTMNFDENSWKHIQERLSSRGFTVREMQKQQCYFPANSQVLFNREGTAHGFKMQAHNLDVYVLPGPPREIEAIWQDHIRPELNVKTLHLDRLVTRSWDTIGVGESEVAFQVEELLKDRPRNLKLDIGYRVHLPYVEVKLTFSQSDSGLWQLFMDKIEKQLAPITVARNFEDAAELVSRKLADVDFTFYDFVSEGFLHSRLSPFLKNLPRWSFKQSNSPLSVDFFESEDDFLALIPYEEDKCIVCYSLNGRLEQIAVEAPMKSELMRERRKQYFAEMALIELKKGIQSEQQ